jgi:hypothetical protein
LRLRQWEVQELVLEPVQELEETETITFRTNSSITTEVEIEDLTIVEAMGTMETILVVTILMEKMEDKEMVVEEIEDNMISTYPTHRRLVNSMLQWLYN